MFRNLFMWILTNVFKIKTETTQKELTKNEDYSKVYEEIDRINFSAIFANKIANYVANDSTLAIKGDNARAELLNMTGQSVWKRIKKISAMALGYGGVIIVPYVKQGKIFYNIVPQDRLTIDEVTGDLITGATVLAERRIVDNLVSQSIYMRWTNYRIENNSLKIEQQYTDEYGKKIDTPDFWADIQQVQSISNVDRVPFGYIKSPTNNRSQLDKYGVPITYGCESTIEEIRDCLKQIAREFELKQAFIAIDKTAVGADGRLPKSGIFTPIDTNVDDFWEVFDPTIQSSPRFERLKELYSRLEKEVGTSSGILTEMQTADATATAIRRAMYDTFAIVSDVRSNIENGMNDFFMACNVLANAYNLTVNGKYTISYDWDYSLLEDSQETFSQMQIGLNQGVISKAEFRNWIKPTETMSESEKAVSEIEEQEMNIQDIFSEQNNQLEGGKSRE